MRLRRSGLEPGSRRCAPTGRRARRPARQSRSDGAARLTGVGAARNREGARILWKRGRPCVQSRSRRSAARAARKHRGVGRCSARTEPKISSIGLKSGISGAESGEATYAQHRPESHVWRGLSRGSFESFTNCCIFIPFHGALILGTAKNSVQKCELPLREGLIHILTHKFCEKQKKPHTTKYVIEIVAEFT